jgi:hypothetical protein
MHVENIDHTRLRLVTINCIFTLLLAASASPRNNKYCIFTRLSSEECRFVVTKIVTLKNPDELHKSVQVCTKMCRCALLCYAGAFLEYL